MWNFSLNKKAGRAYEYRFLGPGLRYSHSVVPGGGDLKMYNCNKFPDEVTLGSSDHILSNTAPEHPSMKFEPCYGLNCGPEEDIRKF